MVSFIHAGNRINGTVEYVLEKSDGLNDFFDAGDCVVKPHPRYKIEGFIVLPNSHLEKLLDEN